jgi:hypothetical protein
MTGAVRQLPAARGWSRGLDPARRGLGWLALVVLSLPWASTALACPICSGTAPNLTLLQHLINADRAVIAQPLGGRDFELLAIVKAAPGSNDRAGVRLRDLRLAAGEDPPSRGSAPVLLLRQSLGGTWKVAGPMPPSAAPAARALVGAKRSAEMTLADWQSRVKALTPMLEHPVPLLAATAHGEIARAPYAAMRSSRGRVSAADLESWIADPALASRRPLYWLLLGINAGPAQARALAARVDAQARVHGLDDLASLLAADLEAGGRARRAVLQRVYFEDRRRMLPELQEAVLAFAVHADAGDAALRRDTARSFARLVRTHRALAGLVAADLARWQHWDAVPDYIALLGSRALHVVWRQPVIDYLLASGRPDALAAVNAATVSAPGRST